MVILQCLFIEKKNINLFSPCYHMVIPLLVVLNPVFMIINIHGIDSDLLSLMQLHSRFPFIIVKQELFT